MDGLISRQAAIDAVETKIKKWNAVDGEGYHVGLGLRYTDVIDTLAELPSAQPEPCDAISRADAIRIASGYCHPANVAQELAKLPSVQPEQRWIPCSERLPEEDEDVLVSVYFMGLKQTHPNGWNDHIKPSYYVDIASHIDGEWSSASDEYKIARSRHKVIAWMPLPEPYREEGE